MGITAYVIKFQNGTYYAGYGKSDTKTLLGAQLYQSEKKAKYIIEKTSDFHYRRNENARIVPIQMREVQSYGRGKRMTNQEAIKTTEKFITDLEASDIPIYADERKALEKLINTAKEYDVLTGIIGICGER